MPTGNIGAAALKRLDFTVIGDVVNTAQRLQVVASPGQIIINEKSFTAVKGSFKCERVGEVSLKNKTNPEIIYNVLD